MSQKAKTNFEKYTSCRDATKSYYVDKESSNFAVVLKGKELVGSIMYTGSRDFRYDMVNCYSEYLLRFELVHWWTNSWVFVLALVNTSECEYCWVSSKWTAVAFSIAHNFPWAFPRNHSNASWLRRNYSCLFISWAGTYIVPSSIHWANKCCFC